MLRQPDRRDAGLIRAPFASARCCRCQVISGGSCCFVDGLQSLQGRGCNVLVSPAYAGSFVRVPSPPARHVQAAGGSPAALRSDGLHRTSQPKRCEAHTSYSQTFRGEACHQAFVLCQATTQFLLVPDLLSRLTYSDGQFISLHTSVAGS